jgi:integrase
VKKLGSGNWRAAYRHRGNDYAADITFACQCKGACVGAPDQDHPRKKVCEGYQRADAALGEIRRRIEAGWDPAEHRAEREAPKVEELPTVADYSERWMQSKRDRGLSRNTLDGYRYNLDHHVLPVFGNLRLNEVTDEQVQEWHDRLLRSPDRPSARAHAYGTLSGIFNSAVRSRKIQRSPCQVPGGAVKERAKPDLRMPDMDEIQAMIGATPERYRMMLKVALWCGLRFCESRELRRYDVNLKDGEIRVERSATTPSTGLQIKRPKTKAGRRTVPMPDWMIPELGEHMERHSVSGADGLVFPNARGGHLSYAGRDLWWYPARQSAGRPDMSWHDLRHVAGTWHQMAGATIRDTMRFMGHTTVAMTLHYQALAQKRLQQVSNNMPRAESVRQAR